MRFQYQQQQTQKTRLIRMLLSLRKSTVRNRLVAGIFLAVFIVAAGVLTPLQQAGAVTKTGTLAPGDQAKSYAYYKALRHCMDVGFYKNSVWTTKNNDMSQQNAIDFEWFNGKVNSTNPNSTTVGIINDASDDGDMNCGDSEGSSWIKTAAQLWGYNSGPQLLCTLGFTREVGTNNCSDTPSGANNNFIAPSNASANLDKFWTDTLGNGSTGVNSIASNGGAYRLYLDSFKAACRPASGGSDYTIQEFAEGSTTPKSVSYGVADRDRGPGYTVRVTQWNSMTCADLAKAISNPTSNVVLGYVKYLKTHDGNDASADTGHGCTDASCPTGNETSCVVEGIGWIICPISNAIAGMTDGLFNIVSSFMQINPILGKEDYQNNLYNSWTAVRNIANVAFVIAFLVIIYAQITGGGLSNYSMKKMLPRLVIAAILVNVSYYMCAIAVDISNILGVSVQNILMSMRGNVASGPSANIWSDLTAFILSAGAIGTLSFAAVALTGAATIWSAVGGLLLLMIPALLAILTAFLVLILRQALILILIVISPLAFVAYLLPNTESWYKKWQATFITMLVFFPIMSLIFGGSQLASAFIMASADTTTIPGFIMYIGGVAVQVIPLFLAPVILMLSKGVLGRFAGMVNNPNKGLVDRGRKALQGSVDLSKKRGLASTNRFGTAARGFNRFKRTREFKGKQYDTTAESTWQERIAEDNNLAQINNQTLAETSRGSEAQKKQKKEYLGALGSDAALLSTAAGLGGGEAETKIKNAIEAEEKQETKKAIENIKETAEFSPGGEGIKQMQTRFETAVASGDTNEARAMQDSLLTSGQAGINGWRKSMANLENEGVDMNTETVTEMRRDLLSTHSGLKASAIDVNTFGVKGGSLTAIQTDPKTYEMSDVELIQQKPSTVQLAISNNAISPQQAKRIIDNDELAKYLDPSIRPELEDIANSTPSPAPSAPTPNSQPNPTPPSAPSPQTPTPSSNPPATPSQSAWAPNPPSASTAPVAPQPAPVTPPYSAPTTPQAPPTSPFTPPTTYEPRENGPNDFLVPRDREE